MNIDYVETTGKKACDERENEYLQTSAQYSPFNGQSKTMGPSMM